MSKVNPAFDVGPVERVSAHSQVSNLLRRAIQLGHFMPGDKLPSEPDLARRLAVSRVTLREAIRQLEGEGYLTSRRPQGLFVTKQVVSSTKRKAYMREEFKRIRQLLDFRAAIEPMAARLAARHRTKKDMAAMEMSIRDMEAATDVPEFRKADSGFHLTLAKASKNDYLRVALEDARVGMFLPFDARDFTVTWSSSPADHAAILEAIRDRDGERAARAMEAHVVESGQEMADVIWGKRGARNDRSRD